MIQDIGDRVFDNSYDPKRTPEASDVIFLFREGNVLAKLDAESKTLEFPRYEELFEVSIFTYLFEVGGIGYFLADDKEWAGAGEWDFFSLNEIRRVTPNPREVVFAAFTAAHLENWYRRSRFCGACGQALVKDERERAMRCPRCDEVFYPRINPAVIVGVTNGGKLLITRYREGYRHNALVAGFAEIGETLEDTVRREVKEETGLSVKNIRYYKSQPWGVASDLLAGFFCEVDGADAITVDESELKSAVFTAREEIELQPSDYSLTNEMMKVFRESNII